MRSGSPTKQLIRSPKRKSSTQSGKAAWFPYYAGFSCSFVEDAIQYANEIGCVTRVLDSWNGSGTTTQVAHSKGLRVDGFDLNPAMLVVAKAKLIDSTVYGSIGSLLDDICEKARACKPDLQQDPLQSWFTDKSVVPFRRLDRAISTLLIDSKEYSPLASRPSFRDVSALACFFYVALFRSLRTYLTPFFGSNPTWVRQAPTDEDKVSISLEDLITIFRREVELMLPALKPQVPDIQPADVQATVDIAESSSLPVSDSAYDMVVSSPPYCTRIDYAVKTRPELALLGLDDARFRSLRDEMLGTPTIPNVTHEASDNWGAYCNRMLGRIKRHPSRASESYYWKTFVQYFDVLHRSIGELGRALKPRGLCFLVVQDSYYKNIHVDLARIVNDMAQTAGMQLREQLDFPTTRTMVGLNSAARSYKEKREQAESVLIWEKHTA
jgi:SAM-dependent methyltransferase